MQVARLRELGAEDRRRFGAKAVSLGLLARKGFPVPDGFALAFEPGRETSLTANERAAIARAHAELVADDPASTRMAVRSSAADEDGAEHSFAGLYETHLDVAAAELSAAIEACLASTQSERVDAYRRAAGTRPGAMGVLVQRMVCADYAGVCFTRAPEGGADMLIEIVAGAGEALVSGTGDPARVRVGRESLALCSEANLDLLDDLGPECVREVARLALQIEDLSGQAMDIEWAQAAGELQLLQARPITAAGRMSQLEQARQEEIRRLREATERAREVVVFTDYSTADMLPRPSPLGHQLANRLAHPGGSQDRAFRAVGLHYRVPDDLGPFYPMIGGRAFINASAGLRAVDPDLPISLDVSALGDLSAGLDIERMPIRARWPGWRGVGRIALALPRWLTIPVRFLRLRPRLAEHFRAHVEPAVTTEAARLRQQDLSALSLPELGAAFRAHVVRFVELHYHHQIVDIMAFGTHFSLRSILKRLYGDGAEAAELPLITGLPGNFNTETNLDLARVAEGTLSLDSFLDRYGHRGHPDYEPAAARWREDPEHVRSLADAIARSSAAALEQFEEQKRVRERAEEKLSADLRKARSRWLRFRHDAALRELAYYQRYSPLREGTQGLCYLFVELMRRALLEAGRRSGLDDLIFCLYTEELDDLFHGTGPSRDELAQRARRRRDELRAARSLYVPHAIRSDQLEAIGRLPALAPGARELPGVAASAGTVRGRARVVASLDQARELRDGEILVTASADPAWTPLFLVAGGLVLEQGGLLSHPAIVAREYGLPAVVGVAHATHLLKSGQEITVDGDSGRVRIETPSAPGG